MQMQDFLLALTSNVAHISFWLAIVATVIAALCVFGLINTSREFEEIEFLGLVKTFIPLSLIFWGFSALPTTSDVKDVQKEFRPPIAKHVKKKDVKNDSKDKETSKPASDNDSK